MSENSEIIVDFNPKRVTEYKEIISKVKKNKKGEECNRTSSENNKPTAELTYNHPLPLDKGGSIEPTHEACESEQPSPEEEENKAKTKTVKSKRREDLSEYVICENCDAKIRKKTFKYSHKNTCKGGNITAQHVEEEKKQPLQPPQPRKLNRLELQKEKYRDIFYKKHF
jgi:hypothetical protein